MWIGTGKEAAGGHDQPQGTAATSESTDPASSDRTSEQAPDTLSHPTTPSHSDHFPSRDEWQITFEHGWNPTRTSSASSLSNGPFRQKRRWSCS